MRQFAASITNGQETSVFDWMAKLAAYPQRSWVIVIAGAAVATIIAELILRLQYTKLTGVALRAVGILFLAYGSVLLYVKFWVSSVKVPSTASIWMPSAGIFLLIAAWGWQRRRARLAFDRTKRILDVAAVRIMTLEQTHGASNFVDQLTKSEKPVLPLIRSMINKKRNGNLVAISGPSGAGKTATLLRYGISCRATRSSRRRPLVPIYVDLAAYAAQFTENPALEDFIQKNFIKNDSPDLAIEKAWDASGRYVEWIFLFDNADEASLLQGDQGWSRQIVTNFLKEYSRSNSFRALMATHLTEGGSTGAVIELGSLTDDGWREFLEKAGVGQSAVDAIAVDEGLYWFLRDPGAINLLAPVLVRRSWTTGDSVNEALHDAINSAFDSSVQTHAFRTATATIKFLMRAPEGYHADAPGNITNMLADIGNLIALPAQEIDSDLTTLAERSVLKRICSRHGDYVKFSSASAAYFYSCALLESPSELSIEELLQDQRLRMTTISLLQAADNECITRFLQRIDSLLDSAVDALDKDQLELLNEQVDVFKKARRVQALKLAESMLADRRNRANNANAALLVLAGGLQNRLELINEELRQKIVKFTRLVMPLCDPRTQAHVLAIRHAFEPPSDEAIKPDPGLNAKDGKVVLDTTSRIVNSLNGTTGLPEADRGRLVAVVLLTGLSSLTLTRGRSNLPASLRLANDVGTAIIILYGIIFGVGGSLQLTSDWRTPFLQVCEVLIAIIVAFPLIASRRSPSWRLSILSINFYGLMKFISISLALLGAIWIFFDFLSDLATFNMPLMPLLACYSLMWPAYAGFYLTYEPDPSAVNIIVPSPRIIQALWRILRSLLETD